MHSPGSGIAEQVVHDVVCRAIEEAARKGRRPAGVVGEFDVRETVSDERSPRQLELDDPLFERLINRDGRRMMSLPSGVYDLVGHDPTLGGGERRSGPSR